MDDLAAPRRSSFGLSLLVALGWYATAVGAIVVGRSGVPAAPDRYCPGFFGCLTPLEQLALFAIVGAPLIAGLLAYTAAATALLARWIPSPILAGSLSALSGVLAVAMATAVWNAAA